MLCFFCAHVLDLNAAQMAALRAHWTHVCIRLRPSSSELELRFELSSGSQLAPQAGAGAGSGSGTVSVSLEAGYARLALSALALAPPLLELELPHSAQLYSSLSFTHWPHWRTALLLHVQLGQCLAQRRTLHACISCILLVLYSYS